MTNRTVGSFAIPAIGQAFEQRTTSFYKFFARLLPSSMLLKLCVSLYEAGIFFLQLFNVFLEQLKLSVEKCDVLLESTGTLSIPEGCNKAAESDEKFIHGEILNVEVQPTGKSAAFGRSAATQCCACH